VSKLKLNQIHEPKIIVS